MKLSFESEGWAAVLIVVAVLLYLYQKERMQPQAQFELQDGRYQIAGTDISLKNLGG